MWFTIKCHCKCSEFQFMKKMEKFDENLWFHFREGIQISQFFHPDRKSKGFAGKPVGKIPYPPWKYLEMILSRGDFHRSTCSPPPLPPSFAGSSTIWPWYFRISEWKTFATLSIRKEWTRIVIILISNQRFGIFSTRIVAVLRVIVISTFCVV